jgi:dTDP-4-dehydrorhamnose 3,5-epimerase-like enzyme
MPEVINLKTHTDARGNLTVIEKVVPFDIKRIFYIYGVDHSLRGGHRHKKTIQGAVCIQGHCTIKSFDHDYDSGKTYDLNDPSKLLILYPADWHVMYDFSPDAILMVLASEYYDHKDYIFEKYKTSENN